jgi:hypothetical protein
VFYITPPQTPCCFGATTYKTLKFVVGSFGLDSFFWQEAVFWIPVTRSGSNFSSNYRRTAITDSRGGGGVGSVGYWYDGSGCHHVPKFGHITWCELYLLFTVPAPLTGTTALVGQGLLIVEASRSHSDTPQSVGLLWMGHQPDAETSTWQHITLTRDRLPCLRWYSNPRSQQVLGRRPTP